MFGTVYNYSYNLYNSSFGMLVLWINDDFCFPLKKNHCFLNCTVLPHAWDCACKNANNKTVRLRLFQLLRAQLSGSVCLSDYFFFP